MRLISMITGALALVLAPLTAVAPSAARSEAVGAQVAYPPVPATLIDQKDVTLDAQGNATWNFGIVFPDKPTIAHMPKAANGTDAVICNWMNVTATSASIHCWRTNVVGGLLSGLLGGSTTGLQVTLIARYIPPVPQ